MLVECPPSAQRNRPASTAQAQRQHDPSTTPARPQHDPSTKIWDRRLLCLNSTEAAYLPSIPDQTSREGGYRSPAKGGYRNPERRGGYRSPRRGGYRSPAKGGYRNPAHGGLREERGHLRQRNLVLRASRTVPHLGEALGGIAADDNNSGHPDELSITELHAG